ncbi:MULTISPECIES: hypothetical protein [unclassified Gilvimarinus]|uniref:hypothetical protein n=1 Tax=Gilvimarinus sp. DZF01 TaxID=3461371 RepID=UPI004045AAFB
MEFQVGPISLARQVFLISWALTPLAYSMMVGLIGKGSIGTKLKHMCLSSIAVYIWLALVFILYIFVVPVLWSLEGILPEVILMFFVDPNGLFSKLLNVCMSGLAIAGVAYLPFYLKRKLLQV